MPKIIFPKIIFMKHILNTLYITSENSYLFWENECIAVRIGGAEKVRIPSHTLDSIVCFGNCTVSTPLIRFCGEHNIALTFLSEHGMFYGRVYGPVTGNVLLRQKQFISSTDQNFSLQIVSNILIGKLLNEKNMLLRAARGNIPTQNQEHLRKGAAQIADLAKSLTLAESVDALRGIEGAAAKIYFACFDDMLHAKDASLKFIIRSRRPPQNEVNAVLSFLYALLKNDVQSALETVGLDPACGYLHCLRSGRPALALDMMEELRTPLCDRLAISLFDRGQLQTKDFSKELGECRIEADTRKKIISAWQARKQETIVHPFLQEKIEIGLIPFVQAQLLARVLRGDLDEYPPMIWR